MYIYTVY